MKIFEANSAMPGVDDGLLIYSGTTPDNESLQYPYQYLMNTQIRNNLFVSIYAIGTQFNEMFQIGYVIVNNTNGTKSIRFQVPRLCRVNYYVCGSSMTTEINSELVDEGRQTVWTHGYYLHNHDGFSGVQLCLANNILPDSVFYANKDVRVNSTGDRFIYVDPEQGTNPPVFTLPALNLPVESIEINPTDSENETFSWDAATNMLITDKYNIVFTAVINPSNSFVSDDIAGTTTSVSLAHSIFDGMSGEVFVWKVVAINTDGTGQTEQRTIFISI